jgi:hypothetical protein
MSPFSHDEPLSQERAYALLPTTLLPIMVNAYKGFALAEQFEDTGR